MRAGAWRASLKYHGAAVAVLLGMAGGMAARPAMAAEPEGLMEVRTHLAAVRKPVISAEIAGRVTTLGFRSGQAFPAGALLLAFDCSMHRAHEARALAQRDRAQRQLASLRQLDRSGATSRVEVGVASADAAAAEAEVRATQVTLQRCEIRAPFAGRVVEQRTQPGEYVPEGQPVLEVIDDSELELEAIVPSGMLARLREGSAFAVALHEVPAPLRARVTRITPLIDPVSQTVKIFARVEPGGPPLIAGMSGVARFTVSAEATR